MGFLFYLDIFENIIDYFVASGEPDGKLSI